MLYQMRLHAAGELQQELETNANMCGLTPQTLVVAAATAMTLLGHRRSIWPDGMVAIKKGVVSAAFDLNDNLPLYRRATDFRVHEGLSPGDLGGFPATDLLIRATPTDRLLRKASSLFGTRSPGETWGFLVWSFNRLLNSVREDFPGGTLGVASPREGDFIPVFGPSPMETESEWVYFHADSADQCY